MHGIRIRTINAIMIVLVAFLAFMFVQTAQRVNAEYGIMQKASDDYIACELAVGDLMNTSTFLTTEARLFTATHNPWYLKNYFTEINDMQHREQDVALLEERLPNSNATAKLNEALAYSHALQNRELYSMKLSVHALQMKVDSDIAAALDALPFLRDDANLTADQMLEKARILITDQAYEHEIGLVTTLVDQCREELGALYDATKQQHADTLESEFTLQQVLTWALLIVVLTTILTVVIAVLQPLHGYIAHIARNERLAERGAYELRFLARAYNVIYEENDHTRNRLVHEAEHDPLTGLYNRGAFDKLIAELQRGPIALVIVDIDYFKSVNDEHGHDCGDRVLKKVAAQLSSTFRSSDCCCRLGGDEFAVIMVDLKKDQRDAIRGKIARIGDALAFAGKDTPAITLSVGVAFSDGTLHPDELYKHADQALYRVKEAGRHGIAFYDEPGVCTAPGSSASSSVTGL